MVAGILLEIKVTGVASDIFSMMMRGMYIWILLSLLRPHERGMLPVLRRIRNSEEKLPNDSDSLRLIH